MKTRVFVLIVFLSIPSFLLFSQKEKQPVVIVLDSLGKDFPETTAVKVDILDSTLKKALLEGFKALSNGKVTFKGPIPSGVHPVGLVYFPSNEKSSWEILERVDFSASDTIVLKVSGKGTECKVIFIEK